MVEMFEAKNQAHKSASHFKFESSKKSRSKLGSRL